MTDSSLHGSAKLLEKNIEIFGVLIDPRVEPKPDSPAMDELQAAANRAGPGSVWGEEPVRMAYELACLQFQAALEHARAMVKLMDGSFSAVPIIVQARALVELTARTYWLLEPGLGHERRVRRLLILRYESAREGERAAKADDATETDFGRYTETTSEVAQYATRLGLDAPSRSSCGSEQLPKATNLVIDLFDQLDVKSVYNLYSGYSHGHPYTLRHEYTQMTQGNAILYKPTINKDSITAAATAASFALSQTGGRVNALYDLG